MTVVECIGAQRTVLERRNVGTPPVIPATAQVTGQS